MVQACENTTRPTSETEAITKIFGTVDDVISHIRELSYNLSLMVGAPGAEREDYQNGFELIEKLASLATFMRKQEKAEKSEVAR